MVSNYGSDLGSPSSSSSSQSKTSKSSKTSFHFLAGLLSGLTSAVLLQPADLLKTRIQSRQTTSILSTLQTILSSPQPIRGLWRGTLPSALRTSFGSALYFATLNALRQGVAHADGGSPNSLASPESGVIGKGHLDHGPDNGKGTKKNDGSYRSSALPRLSNTANLVTGATARVAAGFAMMPVTVIKVRYESDYYAYRSLLGAARDIVRTEGIRGLFSGFGATAVRDGPYAGLYVLFYEQFKRNLADLFVATSDDPRPSPSPSSINFVSGALAAGLATAITNPFDAVKTRLQLMPGRYGNMVRAARLMIREGGLRSLFSGLELRMARKALSSALGWTVYEELILQAEKRWATSDTVIGL